jgi:hypothetical protein
MVKQVKHIVTVLFQKDLMTFPFVLTYFKFVLNLRVFHLYLMSVTPVTNVNVTYDDITPESRNRGARTDVHC